MKVADVKLRSGAHPLVLAPSARRPAGTHGPSPFQRGYSCAPLGRGHVGWLTGGCALPSVESSHRLPHWPLWGRKARQPSSHSTENSGEPLFLGPSLPSAGKRVNRAHPGSTPNTRHSNPQQVIRPNSRAVHSPKTARLCCGRDIDAPPIGIRRQGLQRPR